MPSDHAPEPPPLVLAFATAVLARVQALRGGLLIVNDDPTLAAEVAADGVHVGEGDASVVAAREIVVAPSAGTSIFDTRGKLRVHVGYGRGPDVVVHDIKELLRASPS